MNIYRQWLENFLLIENFIILNYLKRYGFIPSKTFSNLRKIGELLLKNGSSTFFVFIIMSLMYIKKYYISSCYIIYLSPIMLDKYENKNNNNKYNLLPIPIPFFEDIKPCYQASHRPVSRCPFQPLPATVHSTCTWRLRCHLAPTSTV